MCGRTPRYFAFVTITRISQPKHPLPLNKAACASLPCSSVFSPSYSNIPYLNAKRNKVTKHPKGVEQGKELGKGVEYSVFMCGDTEVLKLLSTDLDRLRSLRYSA